MNMRTELPQDNYEPSRHASDPVEDPAYRESETPLEGRATRQRIAKTDDFSQAGEQFRSYTAEQRNNLIANIVNDLRQVGEDTQMRAICNFIRADREYGMLLAGELGVDISGFMGGR